MRQDKSRALRERLQRGARSFDFDALIQGVSTVGDGEEEKPVSEVPEPAEAANLRAEAIPFEPSGAAPEESPDRERLRAALNTLGGRLLEESGKLGAALAARDPGEGGYYLARVNQVLELLHSVDPGGETSRHLCTTAAPPLGRSWPGPAWCVFELAESPLSGLLPAGSDEQFVAEIVAAAIASPDS